MGNALGREDKNMLCIVKKVDRAMNRALEYLVMTMLAVMVLVVTALMPVLGVPLFWYTKSDVGTMP